MKSLVFAALITSLTVTSALAQSSPADIRAMLGSPVNIEQAALFAASRSSYKELCGEDPEFEMHASVINRLQYGSLDEGNDKELFRHLMIGQSESNAGIYAGLDIDGQKAFCEGLNSTITGIAADFVESHPTLFTETQATTPEPEKPGLEEQIKDHVASLDPALQLYVIKMVENRAYDDLKTLIANPENNTPAGQTWVFKVMSGEMMLMSMATEVPFPEISQLYAERSDIYARLVRGEIEWEDLQTLEPKNEAAKKAAYQARLDDLQAQYPNFNPDMQAANAAIDELSSMVIGGGKMLSGASDR